MILAIAWVCIGLGGVLAIVLILRGLRDNDQY